MDMRRQCTDARPDAQTTYSSIAKLPQFQYRELFCTKSILLDRNNLDPCRLQTVFDEFKQDEQSKRIKETTTMYMGMSEFKRVASLSRQNTPCNIRGKTVTESCLRIRKSLCIYQTEL